MINLRIGPAHILLEMNHEYLHSNFEGFVVEDKSDNPDIKITVLSDVYPNMLMTDPIVISPYINVYKQNDVFSITYHELPCIQLISIDSASNTATIYVNKNGDTEAIALPEQISFAIRDIFFSLCPGFNLLPIHSASIIYKGRAYLFSAPSGTGKTTHATLWLENTDAAMLNGDVCLLEANGDTVIAHGIPWCGSSGQFCNRTVPLGKIIFLKRSDSNRISECTHFESVISLVSRSFASSWTKSQVDIVMDIAKSITANKTAATLWCTPTKEAVETVLDFIN